MRVGILGGTFDPVHVGHVALARAALTELNIEKLLVLPNGAPQYKRPRTDPADRLAMACMAMGAINRVEVSDMEILRGGATYAVDTLRILKSAHPDTDYVYIIGLDSLKNLSRWKDAETLKRLCTFACAAREGQVPHQPGVQILRTSIPDISSARIRQMVQSGQNADAFMPQNVARYVAERGLYLSDFSESALRKELRQRLTPHRYAHTLGVAETAAELARENGLCAGKALVAGLLHDCAKCLSPEELLQYAGPAGADADEMRCLPVLHAPVGAYLAREQYGVQDEEVLSAIRRHTVGEKKMSLLDAIVYVADFIEPGRKPFLGLEDARRTAHQDVFRAAALCGRLTGSYAAQGGGHLHPATARMIQWIENGGR